jgi:hypothetical protein
MHNLRSSVFFSSLWRSASSLAIQSSQSVEVAWSKPDDSTITLNRGLSGSATISLAQQQPLSASSATALAYTPATTNDLYQHNNDGYNSGTEYQSNITSTTTTAAAAAAAASAPAITASISSQTASIHAGTYPMGSDSANSNVHTKSQSTTGQHSTIPNTTLSPPLNNTKTKMKQHLYSLQSVGGPPDYLKIKLPVFVASLLKSGTNTVDRYFQCGNISASHNKHKECVRYNYKASEE